MGIWDEFRSVVTRLTNRKAPDTQSDGNACWGPYPGVASAVSKIGDSVIVNGAQKLEEYVPDPDRREKIGRILTNLGKFAINSAVNESLKGVTASAGGIQVYKIVKEGLKDQPLSHASDGNKNQDVTLVMEEMQAKMEKMQEDMNNIKQQNKISIECDKGMEPLEDLSDEPPSIQGSAPQKMEAKKTFIRSRL